MATDDRAAALDAALDALLGLAVPEAVSAAGPVAEQDLAVLHRLRDGWRQPVPDHDFVRRLGANLAALHGGATVAPTEGALRIAGSLPSVPTAQERPGEPWAPPRRDHRTLFAAAALVICVALVATALLGRDGQRRETIPAAAVASPPAANRAVVLLIDVSGSMSFDPLGGEPKLEMAKEAARLVIDTLETGDLLGILAFNEDQTWVRSLTPLASETDRADVVAAIEDLRATGGSLPYPALTIGLEALRSADSSDKLLLVLSDGKGRLNLPDDYRLMVHQVDDRAVTVSSILLGDDADWDYLSAISAASGGVDRQVRRIEEVPAAVEFVLGLAVATPEPDRSTVLPGSATPAAEAIVPVGVRSTAVEVSITVYADYLRRGDSSTEEAAVEQLETALAPFAAAGCRIGFVITEAEAQDIGTGNQIADAVNALLKSEFPELVGGAGFYSVANVGGPTGRVTLLLFPYDDCDVR